MMRIIPDDGAIFYNHKWRVQDGVLQDRQDIMSGFPVRQIIIWRRKGGFNFNPGYFVPTYEVIYLIAKPKFRLAPKANAHGDVWEFMQEMNNEHPAAFPVALIDRIVSATTAKHILDPFMGSGSTGCAAMQEGFRFIGIERDPDYMRIANARIIGDAPLFRQAPARPATPAPAPIVATPERQFVEPSPAPTLSRQPNLFGARWSYDDHAGEPGILDGNRK